MSKRVECDLTDEEFAELEAIALAANMTAEELVRHAVEGQLEAYRSGEDRPAIRTADTADDAPARARANDALARRGWIEAAKEHAERERKRMEDLSKNAPPYKRNTPGLPPPVDGGKS